MKKIFALTFAAAMANVAFAEGVDYCGGKAGNYGAITIKNDGDICAAEIYGDKESSDAAGDATLYTKLKEFEASVNKVVYKRSGIGKKHQTVVLPFSASFDDTKCSLTGAKFYAIGKSASDKEPFVDKNTSGKWIVRTGNNPLSELDAHTPYIVDFESNPAEFTITCPNAININTKASALTLSKGNWDFVGTYSGESWPDGNRNIYGMAGKAKDYTFNVNGKDSTVKVNVGDFVRAGAGASVPPMKAYLRYVGSRALSKAIASSELDDNSPENTPELISVKIPFREEACFLEGDEIIEFKTVNGKKTACIDGQSDARLQTLSIPENVEVEAVVYNRTFSSVGGSWGNFLASTMVLPFSVNKNCVTGADIYQIVNVKHFYDGSKMKVQVQANQWVNDLTANTPYIVTPTAENISFCSELWGNKVTFKLNNSSGTKDVSYSATYEEQGNPTGYPGTWTFKGTYEKLEYGVAPFNGKAYGFASKAKDVDGVQVSAGQFVKAKSGASVPPMRAFLVYDANGVVGAKAAAGVMSSLNDVELPETLEIMLVDKDGVTQAIGTMNTLTGEIKMDDNVWFDMKGRKMNHKPTVKGTYYNKGQKVIIK